MGLFGTSIKDTQLREARVNIIALIQVAQEDINGIEHLKNNPQGAAPGDVAATGDNQIAVRKNKLADEIAAEAQKLKS